MLLYGPSLLALAQGEDDGRAAIAAGTSAFEQGDYRRALELFEAAQRTGPPSASLAYNVGVTQYKLAEYPAAAATFARLAEEFPAMRSIAVYNRGLALLAAGERDAARAAFAEVLRASPEVELEQLARAGLARLDGPTASRSSSRRAWTGLIELGLGYDDNVALVDELSLPSGSESSSPVLEALGYASRRWQARVPIRLDVSGYTVRYSDADEFDQDAVRLDVAAEWLRGTWGVAIGPQVGRSRLAGDGLDRVVGASARVYRSLGERWQLDVRAAYDDIDGLDPRFDYLDGPRRQLRVVVQQRSRVGAARFGYTAESNDRRSASVSADRDRYFLGYRRSLGAGWELDASLGRRESRYRDLTPLRQETLTDLLAGVRRDLANGWRMTVEYRWADNDSTAPAFSYRSNRVVVGVGKPL